MRREQYSGLKTKIDRLYGVPQEDGVRSGRSTNPARTRPDYFLLADKRGTGSAIGHKAL
jgi:hypothetical protein